MKVNSMKRKKKKWLKKLLYTKKENKEFYPCFQDSFWPFNNFLNPTSIFSNPQLLWFSGTSFIIKFFETLHLVPFFQVHSFLLLL